MVSAEDSLCNGLNTAKLTAELNRELSRCLVAFCELKGVPINIYYKSLKPSVLGQTRVKKEYNYSNGKKKVTWLPVIEVSKNIKTLKSFQKTKVLRYVIIHELVHISRAHTFQRRGVEQHEKDFDAEVAQRLQIVERSQRSKNVV
jgi:hypothetical protein